MTKIVDLTQEIYQGMPVYPGHLKTVIWEHATHDETRRQFVGGFSYTSRGMLICDHGPTHVDAVNHFDPRPEAPSVAQMPLETFCGPALCLDVSDFPEKSVMGPEIIQNAEKKARETLTFLEFAKIGIPLTVVNMLVYWLFFLLF